MNRAGEHAGGRAGERGSATAELAVAIASELGFELRDAATGGASDANTTSAAGTPTIDGLGPIGDDDHAPGRIGCDDRAQAACSAVQDRHAGHSSAQPMSAA